ncbi:hypothetical protein [Nocardia arthritidis]|uniref:hypothetical protein n=1 Tax=Nocardia arthritidis TaxID=228602 RepID=UPI00142D2865|nr:hypothetical protein [Nocardia arthritidis]
MRRAETDYSIRPFGAVTVTISGGLVDDFLNRPAPLVVDGVRKDEDAPSPGPAAAIANPTHVSLVDDFLDRPARLIHQADNE